MEKFILLFLGLAVISYWTN